MYNAFVFPSFPQKFLCDSSSLKFLHGNGFDFNRLIEKGVTYCNPEHQKKLESFSERKQVPIIVTRERDVEYAMNVTDKLREWLENTQEEEFSVEERNPFLRKLIYQTSEAFGDRVHVLSEKKEPNKIFFTRTDTEEKLNQHKQKEQARIIGNFLL